MSLRTCGRIDLIGSAPSAKLRAADSRSQAEVRPVLGRVDRHHLVVTIYELPLVTAIPQHCTTEAQDARLKHQFRVVAHNVRGSN